MTAAPHLWMDMATMPAGADVEVRDALAYRAIARRRPGAAALTLVQGDLAGRPICWRWPKDDPDPTPTPVWPVGVPNR
ncbi:hypothetical protein [Chthonobacter rhizosphaerae]|uniref:hypothetical protein n=1 Tax=Chthonobacter rhizosphaerae TaxID=2735553 RepID=UPI0015EF41C1|nr:hypothetical protein [Chthonobacter rhizosphaerae]